MRVKLFLIFCLAILFTGVASADVKIINRTNNNYRVYVTPNGEQQKYAWVMKGERVRFQCNNGGTFEVQALGKQGETASCDTLIKGKYRDGEKIEISCDEEGKLSIKRSREYF